MNLISKILAQHPRLQSLWLVLLAFARSDDYEDRMTLKEHMLIWRHRTMFGVYIYYLDLCDRFRQQRAELQLLREWLIYPFTYPIPSWTRRPWRSTWGILLATAPWHGTLEGQRAFKSLVAHISTGSRDQLVEANDYMTANNWGKPACLSPLSRAILWLYVIPVARIGFFVDWSRGVARALAARLEKAALWLGNWSDDWDEPLDYTSTEYNRAYMLTYYGNKVETTPYDRAADAPVIRRAGLVVSSTVGALVLLCAAVGLVGPSAASVASQLMESARACLVRVLR